VASEDTTEASTEATTATTEATTAATTEATTADDTVSFDNAEKKAARDKATGASGEQVAADSSSTLLSEDTVKNMSQNEIQTAINEIYARHGYKFKDQAIYDYFSAYDWYTPKYSDQEDAKAEFNSTENANIELLQKYRK
jgi:hypothetical protein